MVKYFAAHIIDRHLFPNTTPNNYSGKSRLHFELALPLSVMHIYHMIMLWFNYHARASTIASVRSLPGGSHPDTIVISGLEAPLKQLIRKVKVIL